MQITGDEFVAWYNGCSDKDRTRIKKLVVAQNIANQRGVSLKNQWYHIESIKDAYEPMVVQFEHIDEEPEELQADYQNDSAQQESHVSPEIEDSQMAHNLPAEQSALDGNQDEESKEFSQKKESKDQMIDANIAGSCQNLSKGLGNQVSGNSHQTTSTQMMAPKVVQIKPQKTPPRINEVLSQNIANNVIACEADIMLDGENIEELPAQQMVADDDSGQSGDNQIHIANSIEDDDAESKIVPPEHIESQIDVEHSQHVNEVDVDDIQPDVEDQQQVTAHQLDQQSQSKLQLDAHDHIKDGDDFTQLVAHADVDHHIGSQQQAIHEVNEVPMIAVQLGPNQVTDTVSQIPVVIEGVNGLEDSSLELCGHTSTWSEGPLLKRVVSNTGQSQHVQNNAQPSGQLDYLHARPAVPCNAMHPCNHNQHEDIIVGTGSTENLVDLQIQEHLQAPLFKWNSLRLCIFIIKSFVLLINIMMH